MKVKEMAEEAGLLKEDGPFPLVKSWKVGGWEVQYDQTDGYLSLIHDRDIWYLSPEGAGELAKALQEAKEMADD